LRKSRFLHFGERQTNKTDRQTNRQTDEHMDSTDVLSDSRCRERRLNNVTMWGQRWCLDCDGMGTSSGKVKEVVPRLNVNTSRSWYNHEASAEC